MPRPKGPEEVAFKVSVTVPTHARLLRKAAGEAVGTYVAERLEREMSVAAKNTTPETCKHPINVRIGTGCGVCGKDPVK
jgi:hypothetical protein